MFNFTDGINQVLGVKYTSRTRKRLPLVVYFSLTTETYAKRHAVDVSEGCRHGWWV